MWTWSNRSVGSVNFPKTGVLWRETLAVWQPLQVRHHLAISIFMPCNINRVLIKGLVALCDGWPKPCKFEKTFRRNFAVRYGRLCPVDTSHQINWLSNDFNSLNFIVDVVECLKRVNSASLAWSRLIVYRWSIMYRRHWWSWQRISDEICLAFYISNIGGEFSDES